MSCILIGLFFFPSQSPYSLHYTILWTNPDLRKKIQGQCSLNCFVICLKSKGKGYILRNIELNEWGYMYVCHNSGEDTIIFFQLESLETGISSSLIWFHCLDIEVICGTIFCQCFKNCVRKSNQCGAKMLTEVKLGFLVKVWNFP